MIITVCSDGRSDVNFYFIFSFSKLAIIFFTTLVIEKNSMLKVDLISFLPKILLLPSFPTAMSIFSSPLGALLWSS